MAFNFDRNSETIKQSLKKSQPIPFPEIWERMNLPADVLSKEIRKHIYKVFENSGMKGVEQFRIHKEKKRQRNEQRLQKEPDSRRFHLEVSRDYFDIWIDHIDNMDCELRRIATKKAGSNASKLHVAERWLTPLMERITAFDLPTHEDVEGVIKKAYSEFELDFDLNKLGISYFAKGGIYNKTSIAKAVIFIINAKHPDLVINDYTTITKRYKDLGW